MAIARALLQQTTNLRFSLGVLLLVSSVFIIIGLSAHQGWAMGMILTRSVYDTPTVPIPCPEDILAQNPNASCTSSQTVLSNVETLFDYGLFRDLSYTTATYGEVTTKTFQWINATSTLIRSHLDYNTSTATVVQDTYQLWLKGNPGAGPKVQGSQAFLVLGFWCTFFSWFLLVLGLHWTRLQRAAEARIKLGSHFLLASAACLFLSYSIWGTIPASAFTTMCTTGGGGASTDDDVTCTQLLTSECAALQAQDPQAWCVTTSDITKRAGMWGLVFFTCLLQLLSCGIWGKLYGALVWAAPGEEEEEEGHARDRGGLLTASILPPDEEAPAAGPMTASSSSIGGHNDTRDSSSPAPVQTAIVGDRSSTSSSSSSRPPTTAL